MVARLEHRLRVRSHAGTAFAIVGAIALVRILRGRIHRRHVIVAIAAVALVGVFVSTGWGTTPPLDPRHGSILGAAVLAAAMARGKPPIWSSALGLGKPHGPHRHRHEGAQ